MSEYQKRIVFDFDGVIHQYKTPFIDSGIIPDPPVEGIKELIDQLRNNGFTITICSTRASDINGSMAILKFLEKYNISYDEITTIKPIAECYIDDRAIQFNGTLAGYEGESLYEYIKKFKPWNR